MSIELFNFLSNKKKNKNASANDSKLLTAEPEKLPEYEEGFNEKDNVVVRLVNNKRPKKVYQVSGIDDIASKNNWKAWIYLAPVLVLLSVFLLYPLINTIFIDFIWEIC